MLLCRPVALTNTTCGVMYVFPVLVVPWKFVARISESASKRIFNGTISFDIFELFMLMIFTSSSEVLIFSNIFSKSSSFPKNFKKQNKYHLIMQNFKICGFIRVKISNIYYLPCYRLVTIFELEFLSFLVSCRQKLKTRIFFFLY